MCVSSQCVALSVLASGGESDEEDALHIVKMLSVSFGRLSCVTRVDSSRRAECKNGIGILENILRLRVNEWTAKKVRFVSRRELL